ncbi:transposase [Colletotrichum incanum]|uniref:Transposase n=1 Tax=Colletotrichum incanum TaxID=1573173 RepID=A0A166L4Q1_COLIC|nr:transposase [Colletotrichum incanum]
MPHLQHQHLTFNYRNISSPHPTNLLFFVHTLHSPMVQYSEGELDQALEAIANGTSIHKASHLYGSPSQPSRTASEPPDWCPGKGISADLRLAPTHQQVKELAQRILHALGDTEPLGN